MKVLLFGDAPMSEDEGGLCQTLYNIFSVIEPENFLGITAISKAGYDKIGLKYSPRYLSYKYVWLKIPPNRVGKFFVPLIEWINYSICQLRNYRQLKKEIKSFNPDVVVSCPNLPIGVLMHHKLLNSDYLKHKIIPYFMDDWMYKSKKTWLGGSIQKSIKKILSANTKWMMISKELDEILRDRYKVKPEKILYIRNPVDLSSGFIDNMYRKKDFFTIAYAGALWPMHYDSFLLMAKAVNLLSEQINIKLILYSPLPFWENKKNELEPLTVSYGGRFAYNQIHSVLNQADALLITSSFEDDYFTHSKASLQTKITDYCKAGRLIISCGPDYSANNNFLKENNCGICIETKNVDAVVTAIKNVVINIAHYQYMVNNGFDSLQHFSKEVVHKKLITFLSNPQNNVKREAGH